MWLGTVKELKTNLVFFYDKIYIIEYTLSWNERHLQYKEKNAFL